MGFQYVCDYIYIATSNFVCFLETLFIPHETRIQLLPFFHLVYGCHFQFKNARHIKQGPKKIHSPMFRTNVKSSLNLCILG